jgi:hypothetical protein
VRKRRRVALPASVLDMAAAGQGKGQPATEHLQRRVRDWDCFLPFAMHRFSSVAVQAVR